MASTGAFQEVRCKKKPSLLIKHGTNEQSRSWQSPAASTHLACPPHRAVPRAKGAASRAGSAPSARWSCPAQVCTDARAGSWARLPRPEQLRWGPSSPSSAMALGRLAADPAGCGSFPAPVCFICFLRARAASPSKTRPLPSGLWGKEWGPAAAAASHVRGEAEE